MHLRLLAAADIRSLLPMQDAIEAMRVAFRALHAGEAAMPVRQQLALPDGTTLFMPAHLGPAGSVGQKVVSVFPGNGARGLPTIHALVTLLDGTTGAPRAVVEGSTLTALRTGAVTGLATDLLAPPDARVLTIFGAGGQAPHQIEGVCAVRPIEEIRLVSRGPSAGQLAARLQAEDPSRRYLVPGDVERAVREADIIVAATTTRSPLFLGAWVSENTLVNGVGSFRPDMAEVDAALLQRAAVIVDQEASAREEAGELIQAVAQGAWAWAELYAELGALVAGARPLPDRSLRFFKSCGLAIQDIAAAHALLAAAEREGVGQMVEL